MTLSPACADALPVIFAGLMALASFVYTVLDGYDMGVGLWFWGRTAREKDVMMSSIGPFWDANETWLVLAVGLLLVAFPGAQGIVLGNLYGPVAVMLTGLMLRGASFEFRAKSAQRELWDALFTIGSILMMLSQGFMLGALMIGFAWDALSVLFCSLMGFALAAAYGVMGAGWLMMKTDGALQKRASLWALSSVRWMAGLGILLAAMAVPTLEAAMHEKFFSFPGAAYFMPVPVTMFGLFVWIEAMLRKGRAKGWHVFATASGIFFLFFVGLSYGFYPFIVPGRISLYDAAAAPESLVMILIGALAMLPFILGYTFYAYKVFHGKTEENLY